MRVPKRTQVVIAGAGPVGQFAALVLARRGIDVAIFDAQPHRSVHSYALTLHPGTLSLLDDFGLLEDLVAGSRKVSRIRFYRDSSGVGSLDLTAADLGVPYVAVAGQNDLENVLEKALREAGVVVRWNHRVAQLTQESDKVRVRVDELEERTVGYAVAHTERMVRTSRDIEASFVIGADGCHSLVRHSLRIPFPEVGPAEDFAIFEFTADCGDCDSLQIVEKDDRVNVRWPIGGRGCRWSFQLDENEAAPRDLREKSPQLVQLVGATAMRVLSVDRLRELLNERVPWCPARVSNNYWRLWVRFERRLVERFGQGRVWLAGDAAHLAGPVGVQSMNVGMREVAELVEKMVSVLKSGAVLNSLEGYQHERLAEWRFLLGLDGGLEPGADAHPSLAANHQRLLSWLPASGPELATLAEMLGFTVRGAPAAASHGPHATA